MAEPAETSAAWDPFDRPLFSGADARTLGRVGVVDVGSNSVRLVVFDGAARSPAYFFNEKILCGLGTGLVQTGYLDPDGKRRALAALRRFRILALEMGIAPLTVVATAAVREARDGAAFREIVLRETGIAMRIIDGSEEARLSAQGVLLGWPDAEGLVCDLGGSSLEFACLSRGTVGRRASAALGPLVLQSLKGGRKVRRDHIAAHLGTVREQLGSDHARLFLVGGSWRAVARIDMLRRGYPLTVLHEYRMTPAAIRATADFIARTDLATISDATSTSMARLSLVPVASEVLVQLVRIFRPKEIAVSSYGIREGLLYQQMPVALRRRDPLIEACRFAEARDARMPGFGSALYDFLLPLFSGTHRSGRADALRLLEAACLLHDVSWRAHPDYRHEACFDNVTRANLGGLTHEERVFLGLALLHRYKNTRSESGHSALFALLDDARIRKAEIVGKALRFGAMFAMENPGSAGRLRFYPRRRVLELALNDKGRALYGEVAAVRLGSLARAMEATISVVEMTARRASPPRQSLARS